MKKRLAAGLFGVAFLAAGGIAAAFLREPPSGGGEPRGLFSLKLRDLQQQPFKAADLSGTDSSGTDSSGKKKYILVNFWATWCPPCLHEMPLLEKAAAAMPAVKVVGISYEENALVAEFIRENKVKYDILTTSDDIFQFFHENGNPSGGMPYTLLLTPDGEVIRNKIGDFKTLAELKSFVSGKDLL